MLGSSIIDIAIGMVFVYLLLSLICSATNEILERFSRQRARGLEKGIMEMLHSENEDESAGVKETEELVRSVYEHPLVYSLFAKPYSPGAKTLPSYIPSRNFALALMDLIGNGMAAGATAPSGTSPDPSPMVRLRAAIDANEKLPEQVKKALRTFVDASNSPARVRENIEQWFDSSMDRVSGFYKRRSQMIVLIIGLILTILLNVDTITLIRTLSTDRVMRDSLVAAATEYAKNNTVPPAKASASPTRGSADSKPPSTTSPTPASAGNINSAAPENGNNAEAASAGNSNPAASSTNSPAPGPATVASAGPSPTPACDTPECLINQNLGAFERVSLPIGWSRTNNPPDPRSIYISRGQWGLRIIGWLITALALSLGAPFWFDLLNKFMVVRATVKPKEKSPDEPSKG